MLLKALDRNPQLVQPAGPYQGKLAFPWSYGVVLPNITRRQFQGTQLDQAIEPQRVICQDEMLESGRCAHPNRHVETRRRWAEGDPEQANQG